MGFFPSFLVAMLYWLWKKSGEDNRIDEKAGDIYLESPLNEETPVLTEDGGSLLLSEWGYERENVEFSLSREVYKLELVKAFRDQWKETSGEYTPEGDMPPLYQANKENPKSVNDINFKNWLWREYNIKLEDIILLESQLNENLALALRHQNKIGITHTSDGIRITEENKCDPVIQKEIYEDWKKNSGQYDLKNDVIPEWEMDALHPRTVNDMKFEQYLLREYGMTKKEEIEKTFGGNVDALLKMSTIFDVFTLGAAAVAKLTGKKVWKEVGEEVGEKAVAGETSEILEKELVEGTTDDVAKIVTKVEKGSESNVFRPPTIYKNKDGILTNGRYTIDTKGMNRHRLNPSNNGKSQFLYDIDSDKAVLDAASYADEYNLWGGSDHGNKAKVLVKNGPVGVVAETGELTDYINVYRTLDGKVHGSPATPPKQKIE